MTTTYYQWGVLIGGIDPNSGLAPTSGGTPYGPPEQFSGALGAGVTTITFSHDTKAVTIRNTDDINAFQYSFDNVTWFDCIAYQVIQETVETGVLYLQPVAGAPTYEVLGVLTA
jgi:hypothetical protein